MSKREGMALFAKDEKAMERKGGVAPGQHGHRGGRKLSEYGVQLREKQKVKRIYGLMERQFANLVEKAARKKGDTGENMLALLETRLDNVVYRLGFVPSRMMARQLVGHGHILVNGKKLTIPSYQVRPGQTISLSGKALNMPVVVSQLKKTKEEKLASYLKKKAAAGQLDHLPKRDEIELPAAESLIVEFYSR